MQMIVREQAKKYAFDWRDEPLLRVREGETIAIETWSRARGSSRRRWIRRFRQIAPARSLAADGQSDCRRFILKARNGAMCWWSALQVEVADYSWAAVGPKRGPLGESTRWPELSSEYTTKIFPHTPAPVAPCRMAHCNSAILSLGLLRRLSALSARPWIVKCNSMTARAHGVAT